MRHPVEHVVPFGEADAATATVVSIHDTFALRAFVAEQHMWTNLQRVDILDCPFAADPTVRALRNRLLTQVSRHIEHVLCVPDYLPRVVYAIEHGYALRTYPNPYVSHSSLLTYAAMCAPVLDTAAYDGVYSDGEAISRATAHEIRTGNMQMAV